MYESIISYFKYNMGLFSEIMLSSNNIESCDLWHPMDEFEKYFYNNIEDIDIHSFVKQCATGDFDITDMYFNSDLESTSTPDYYTYLTDYYIEHTARYVYYHLSPYSKIYQLYKSAGLFMMYD